MMVHRLSRCWAMAWFWGGGGIGALLAQQVAPESRAFVTVDAPAEAYVSQPVEVVITLGYDAEWFAAHAVSLFRQQLDVPFHVEVPWLQAAPERAVTFLPVADEAQRQQVAIGDRMVAGLKLAVVERDGRSFQRVAVRARWLPLVDGVSQIAPVRLRFAYANEFREHLLRGREPIDQQLQDVRSQALELRVLPLPKDAPMGFGGAVGDFRVEATSGGEEVCVGDVFQVEVTIVGDGNRERFAALQPPALDGFHVQGVREVRVDGARRFVLDVLALRPQVTEMPGVPFVAFSPTKQQFVTSHSTSVPVRVLPQREGVALAKNIQQLIDEDAAKQVKGMPGWVFRWGFIALTVVGLLLYRRGQSSKGRRQLSDAVQQLRLTFTKDQDADRTADAFERVMTVLAGVERFVVPAVWNGLTARGLAPEGLKQLQSLHAELDAARFGGPPPPAEAVMAVVDTVVAAS